MKLIVLSLALLSACSGGLDRDRAHRIPDAGPATAGASCHGKDPLPCDCPDEPGRTGWHLCDWDAGKYRRACWCPTPADAG